MAAREVPILPMPINGLACLTAPDSGAVFHGLFPTPTNRAPPKTLPASVTSCAADVAKALGARGTGPTWYARCPAHDDTNPSLSITDRDGRVLVRCHAGCDQEAVIDALREKGLWGGRRSCGSASPVRARHDQEKAERQRLREEIGRILEILETSEPADGSPVEAYLRGRGIAGPIPETLRFHPKAPLSVKPGGGGTLPAMIAPVVSAAGTLKGLHVTYIRPDGSGKADIRPQRRMMGSVKGGAIRLGEMRGGELAVAEGIETALSFRDMTSKPTWSALSAEGLNAFIPPAGCRRLIVAADGDKAGITAARALACRARTRCTVEIHDAPAGRDWNDEIRGTV